MTLYPPGLLPGETPTRLPGVPAVLTLPYWQARVEAAEGDLGEVYTMALHVHDLAYSRRVLIEQVREVDTAARVAVSPVASIEENVRTYLALDEAFDAFFEPRRRRLSLWLQEQAVSLPTLDDRVLGLPALARQPKAEAGLSEVATALFRNPMLPFWLLSVPEERRQHVDEALLALFDPQRSGWMGTGQVSEEETERLLHVDVIPGLHAWRQQRGLSPVMEGVLRLLSPGSAKGLGNLWITLKTAQEVAQASFVDMVAYRLEWEAIWHQVAAREGLVLPPHGPLLAAAQTLDLTIPAVLEEP